MSYLVSTSIVLRFINLICELYNHQFTYERKKTKAWILSIKNSFCVMRLTIVFITRHPKNSSSEHLLLLLLFYDRACRINQFWNHLAFSRENWIIDMVDRHLDFVYFSDIPLIFEQITSISLEPAYNLLSNVADFLSLNQK